MEQSLLPIPEAVPAESVILMGQEAPLLVGLIRGQEAPLLVGLIRMPAGMEKVLTVSVLGMALARTALHHMKASLTAITMRKAFQLVLLSASLRLAK